jgi:hypothetical protein
MEPTKSLTVMALFFVGVALCASAETAPAIPGKAKCS